MFQRPGGGQGGEAEAGQQQQQQQQQQQAMTGAIRKAGRRCRICRSRAKYLPGQRSLDAVSAKIFRHRNKKTQPEHGRRAASEDRCYKDIIRSLSPYFCSIMPTLYTVHSSRYVMILMCRKCCENIFHPS